MRWWAAADLAAKSGLAVSLVLAVLDPDWGNMAGKAPVARAVTYPLWSLTVPVVWFLTGGQRHACPWIPDTFVTITCFTDVLGNRLDLYDRRLWFDDGVHLVNVALLSAALAAADDRRPDEHDLPPRAQHRVRDQRRAHLGALRVRRVRHPVARTDHRVRRHPGRPRPGLAGRRRGRRRCRGRAHAGALGRPGMRPLARRRGAPATRRALPPLEDAR
ncbi:hypothetical protein GCM10009843_16140 [Nocardioides bigeumensis]|uniref:Uncharacterized protein n=1 Tax=Nocardioides bigeumensis TaxID=433657 RepID=A0ABP5JRJ5_9ACTN